MKLSILIPVFNERGTVLEVIRRVRAAAFPASLELEVVVVDDGSTDGTADALGEVEALPRVRIHRARANGGKGAALRTGIAIASGDWIAFQDADLELDPADLPALIEAALAGAGDAVYGSRFLGRPHCWGSIDYWGNRGLTLLTNLVYGSRLTDMQTCYKVFRGDFLRSLPLSAQGFEIEAEITALALQRGLAIVELPIRYWPRTADEGKKRRRRHGVAVVLTLLRLARTTR